MSGDSNKTPIITAVIAAVALIIATIISSYWAAPSKPSDTGIVNSNSSTETKSPAQQLNFAIAVRDRDSNHPIGQANVLLTVENERVVQAIADDNGQATFSIDKSYYGKSARLYVTRFPSYQPADLEVSLPVVPGKIIQLVSIKK